MNISAMIGAASSARSSSTATSGDFNQIVTDWLLSERPNCTLTELKKQMKALYPDSSHVVTCRYRCKTGPPADVNLTHSG